MNVRRLGAIDIGSNSVRLLITDVLDYNGRAVFKKDSLIRIPLKLGEDTFSTGYISEQKKEKLAILMQSFRGLIQVNDVEIWRACATSAIREASNAQEVLEYVVAKSGIEIDVIDSKEEARFILTNRIDELLEENRVYIYRCRRRKYRAHYFLSEQRNRIRIVQTRHYSFTTIGGRKSRMGQDEKLADRAQQRLYKGISHWVGRKHK